MQWHVEQLCAENWRPWLKRTAKAHAISLIDCKRYDILRDIIGRMIAALATDTTAAFALPALRGVHGSPVVARAY